MSITLVTRAPSPNQTSPVISSSLPIHSGGTTDDGRELPVSLTWFPRLLLGSPEQRDQWELIGQGEGLHWETLDEDISVAGLLAGRGDHSRTRSQTA